MKMKKYSRLFIHVCILVGSIIVAKLVFHFLGWEIISINPLFSGIVAANIFLLGFLLSGVLSDYKESERLPGELSTSLENLAQEIIGIKIANSKASISTCLNLVQKICKEILAWFFKQHSTVELLEHINDLTPQIALLEPFTQGTLLARLKQEQSNLRKTIIRIHTIRETSFVSAGYLLADITTFLLCIGLVLAKIEPFVESMFFVSIISFLMIFLIVLIRDLDNPFGFYDRNSRTDVSLKPLEMTIESFSSENYSTFLKTY
mgnify:FL=1